MLTQLSTLKTRLAIPAEDTTSDALLNAAIAAVSARFDRETNRTLARTENATHEFSPSDAEILVPCYPIETVTKFELKSTESEGWQEVQPAPDYLIRKGCVISLSEPISFRFPPSRFSLLPLARVTYTGGYLLPGGANPPAAPAIPLPADLEQAAVEQVAFWFQNRDKLGLDTIWPHSGTYEKFIQSDLLLQVKAVLQKYERWAI
jgi:hypothetical protein